MLKSSSSSRSIARPLNFFKLRLTIASLEFRSGSTSCFDATPTGTGVAAWQPGHTAYLIGSRTFMLGHDGEWIDEWRRKMAEVSVRGLECHARVTLEVSGRPSEAERVARQLVELAPFRESGHRLLMLALEQAGNRAEALLVFDRLRTLLAEELGTSPGPEVSEVHARLLGARA